MWQNLMSKFHSHFTAFESVDPGGAGAKKSLNVTVKLFKLEKIFEIAREF
jgi:hypothetical protein